MKKAVIPSPLTQRVLQDLAANVQLARLRRGLSLRLVSERSGISANTLMALEKGSSGTSLGVLINVLHVLGLAQDISLIAKDDQVGRALQDLGLKNRKRAPKQTSQKT